MTPIQAIIAVVIIIALINIILFFMSKSEVKLSSMQSGMIPLNILSSSIPIPLSSSNYTYSSWFYINQWSSDGNKVIMQHLNVDADPSPKISLGATQNNLTIQQACVVSGNSIAIHKCEVKNIPIQKWVNLLISVNGRSLDVYIDGKLVRTCVLPGQIKNDGAEKPIEITPAGKGFHGWTSNFKYWNTSTNPSEAHKIYKAGYGGSVLGNLFNKYRLKVAFVKDGVETNSLHF